MPSEPGKQEKPQEDRLSRLRKILADRGGEANSDIRLDRLNSILTARSREGVIPVEEARAPIPFRSSLQLEADAVVGARNTPLSKGKKVEAEEGIEETLADPVPEAPDLQPSRIFTEAPISLDVRVGALQKIQFGDVTPKPEETIPGQTASAVIGPGTVGEDDQGDPIYTTGTRFDDGFQANHNIASMLEIVPEGQTIDDYEAGVLSKEDFTRNARRTINGMSSLADDARPRLQAFIATLEAKGHSVDVRETRRSQERQEWLFQQGRTRGGNIVTWTLTSNHRTGRAMDIFVDDDPSGRRGTYKVAWDLAEEMGLITLRERDPGHFSVPGPKTGGK